MKFHYRGAEMFWHPVAREILITLTHAKVEVFWAKSLSEATRLIDGRLR